MKAWLRGTRRGLSALLGLVCCALPAKAEPTTATAPSALSTQARLDFTINIDKFLFMRVGNAHRRGHVRSLVLSSDGRGRHGRIAPERAVTPQPGNVKL